VVLAYVGPDGTVVTQVIMGSQQFDARTGVLIPLPNVDKTGMAVLAKLAGLTLVPTPIVTDRTIYFVSPH
jgi:hypothetical protein